MIKIFRKSAAIIVLLMFILCCGCGTSSGHIDYLEGKEYSIEVKQEGSYVNDDLYPIDLEHSGFYYGDTVNYVFIKYYYCSICKTYLDCDENEYVKHYTDNHIDNVDTKCPFCNEELNIDGSSKQNALREHCYVEKCQNCHIVNLPPISESFDSDKPITEIIEDKNNEILSKLTYKDFTFINEYSCKVENKLNEQDEPCKFNVLIYKKSNRSPFGGNFGVSVYDNNNDSPEAVKFIFDADGERIQRIANHEDRIYKLRNLEIPESYEQYNYQFFIVFKTPRNVDEKLVYYDKINCVLA